MKNIKIGILETNYESFRNKYIPLIFNYFYIK